MSAEGVTNVLIRYWNSLSQQSSGMPALAVNAADGTLVVGNGYHIPVADLNQYIRNPNIMRLMSSQIFTLPSDDVTRFNLLRLNYRNDMQLLSWVNKTNRQRNENTVKLLLDVQLKDKGFFKRITGFISNSNSGVGIIEINMQVNISIVTLNSLDSPVLKDLCQMMSCIEVVNGQLTGFKQNPFCIIQPEFNRNKALQWFDQERRKYNFAFPDSNVIRPNDKNRLRTLRNAINHFKPEVFNKILGFAFFMKPRNVSEFVSYIEFGNKELSNFVPNYSARLYRAERQVNRNIGKLIAWQQTKAASDMNFNTMSLKFSNLAQMATDNNMCGIMAVTKNLSNDQLMTDIAARVTEVNL